MSEQNNELGVSLADVLATQQGASKTEAPSANAVLRYVGNADGHGFHVMGVPACDLTQKMIAVSGYTVDELLAFSGPVYALAAEQESE